MLRRGVHISTQPSAETTRASIPWQVGIAGATLMLLSVRFAISSLKLLLPVGDRLGITGGLADYQAR